MAGSSADPLHTPLPGLLWGRQHGSHSLSDAQLPSSNIFTEKWVASDQLGTSVQFCLGQEIPKGSSHWVNGQWAYFMWNTALEGKKKSQLCFYIPKQSSNNPPRKWPSLLAMTTEATHLFLFFLEAQSEACQPSIPHSTYIPASSRLSPVQMLGLWAFSSPSQACALRMACLAHTLGCFPQRIWVMLWTNNKMFVWTALLWKSCSGVPVFILITITFLRNWQITSYLA